MTLYSGCNSFKESDDLYVCMHDCFEECEHFKYCLVKQSEITFRMSFEELELKWQKTQNIGFRKQIFQKNLEIEKLTDRVNKAEALLKEQDDLLFKATGGKITCSNGIVHTIKKEYQCVSCIMNEQRSIIRALLTRFLCMESDIDDHELLKKYINDAIKYINTLENPENGSNLQSFENLQIPENLRRGQGLIMKNIAKNAHMIKLLNVSQLKKIRN